MRLSRDFAFVINEFMPESGEWLNTFDEYRDDTREMLDKTGISMAALLEMCAFVYPAPVSKRMIAAIKGATQAELDYAEARFRSIFEQKTSREVSARSRKIEKNPIEIVVRVEHQYGQKRVFVESAQAKDIAALTGTKSLTAAHIAALRNLGFTITIQRDENEV